MPNFGSEYVLDDQIGVIRNEPLESVLCITQVAYFDLDLLECQPHCSEHSFPLAWQNHRQIHSKNCSHAAQELAVDLYLRLRQLPAILFGCQGKVIFQDLSKLFA